MPSISHKKNTNSLNIHTHTIDYFTLAETGIPEFSKYLNHHISSILTINVPSHMENREAYFIVLLELSLFLFIIRIAFRR